MVYCYNCGTKNDDNAEFCSKCGEPLVDVNSKSHRRHRDDRYGRQGNENSGLPYGNIIGPVIGGVILIMVGITALTGFTDFWQYLLPAIIILIGLFIIIGAVYRSQR
ncbi:zinc-ribbon domain-containing protein [uncultured Methanobacterium sp.]|uniref:zinc-ribbon domain-containing protein n=1 Tax=uncultured Methanobacterium sp. TaxID=176306 RepID=UPI002806066C|nr:zinc-ribbon domain-containing protein [uncultured Methanobacterium sp.]